jgi:LacI family transcriptional regulator
VRTPAGAAKESRRPATIKDVARLAAVSIATVSRALNGKGRVGAELQERVNTAARRLRYTPHQAARALIMRRTHTVGVLLPDIHGEYFSELIRGIDRAARQKGLHLLVSSSHGDASEAAQALAAMKGRVDGVLLMTPHLDPKVPERLLPESLPVVMMNMPACNGQLPTLLTDNYGGALAMVRHLKSMGYRRIALITGPAGNWDSDERQRGYRDALKAPPAAWSRVVRGQFTEDSGYAAGRELLAGEHRPDAIFASNDVMAIGCLCAILQAGLRVPGDIALAGFDDIPIARYVTPPLTTVRAQITELGRQSLDALAASLRKRSLGRGARKVLATQLVIRESCGSALRER